MASPFGRKEGLSSRERGNEAKTDGQKAHRLSSMDKDHSQRLMICLVARRITTSLDHAGQQRVTIEAAEMTGTMRSEEVWRESTWVQRWIRRSPNSAGVIGDAINRMVGAVKGPCPRCAHIWSSQFALRLGRLSRST